MQEIKIDTYLIENDNFFIFIKEDTIITAGLVNIFETEKSNIWLINPNNDSIDIHKLEKIDNVNHHTFEIEGIWSAVVKNKKNNEIKILVSVHNELCFYYNKKFRVACTNIFPLIKLIDKVEIDPLSTASFLAFDFVYGRRTLIKNIEKSYGGDVITINKDLKIKELNLTKWLGFDKCISDEKILMEIIREETKKYINNKNILEITLTGGSDSRAILGLINSITDRYELMIGVPSTVDPRDIKVAQLISKKINKSLQQIDASRINIKDTDKIFKEMILLTSCNFIPRNYLLYYKEFLIDKKFYENKIRFMGYRGEIFKGFYQDIKSYLLRKTILLEDKIRHDLIDFVYSLYDNYKKLDLSNSNELFYQRERDNIWVSSNIKTYLQSTVGIVTPFGFNNLLAAGYRYDKGLKHTKIHNNLINLLPKNITRINTRRSILNRLLLKAINRFKNKFDPNFFIEPEIFLRHTNTDLLNGILRQGKFSYMLTDYKKRGGFDSIMHKIYALSILKKII